MINKLCVVRNQIDRACRVLQALSLAGALDDKALGEWNTTKADLVSLRARERELMGVAKQSAKKKESQRPLPKGRGLKVN